MKNDLKIVEQWLNMNNLFLNYEKAVILLHGVTCNTYDLNC